MGDRYVFFRWSKNLDIVLLTNLLPSCRVASIPVSNPSGNIARIWWRVIYGSFTPNGVQVCVIVPFVQHATVCTCESRLVPRWRRQVCIVGDGETRSRGRVTRQLGKVCERCVRANAAASWQVSRSQGKHAKAQRSGGRTRREMLVAVWSKVFATEIPGVQCVDEKLHNTCFERPHVICYVV